MSPTTTSTPACASVGAAPDWSESRSPSQEKFVIEEWRDRVVDAGCGLVEARAAEGIRLTGLGLEAAAAAAGVDLEEARGLWEDDAAFHRDVTIALIKRTYPRAGTYSEHTMTIGQALLADHSDRLESVEGRRWLFVELCRRAYGANESLVKDSREWFRHIGLASLLVATGDGARHRELLVEVMAAEEAEFVELMSGFYNLVSSILGLRARIDAPDPYAVSAVLGRSLADGFALGTLFSNSTADMVFYGDPFDVGDTNEWTLSGFAFTAVALAIFEPHPRFDTQAGIRRVQVFGGPQD